MEYYTNVRLADGGIIMKLNRQFLDDNGKHVLGITIVLIAIVTILFTLKTSNVKVITQGVKVSSLYSLDLNFQDIGGITLKETLPASLKRVNGLDWFGTAYIGNFKSDELGNIKMFVHSTKSTYIYIETKRDDYKYIIVNSSSAKETEMLYNKIAEKINK